MRRLRRIQCKQKSLIRIIFHFFSFFFLTLNGFISMLWIWNPISSCQRVGLYVNKHNINVRFYFLCICAKQKNKNPTLFGCIYALPPPSCCSCVICIRACVKHFYPPATRNVFFRNYYFPPPQLTQYMHIMSHSCCPFCLQFADNDLIDTSNSSYTAQHRTTL
jgi:hypothetical protein